MPQSQTGGLSEHLALKREARVMVTRNFDIKDRLLDGRIGLVSYFKHKGGKITEIYVKLDDRKAGKVARSNDNYNKVNGAAPVRMVDVQFYQATFSYDKLQKSSISRDIIMGMYCW